jgi:hypothetical protein
MLEQSEIPEEGSEQLVECLAGLARGVPDAGPEPGPELAALMATGSRVVSAPFGRRHRRVLAAGVLAVGAVAAGGIAAAANELPPAAQSVVAEFSERFLPFELPHPDVRRPERGDDSPPELDPIPVDGPDQGVVTREDEGADTSPGGAPTPAQARPTTTPSPTKAPSSAPSPSATAVPTPDALDPASTALPGTPEATSAPQEPAAEEPAEGDGDSQAAPGEDLTSTPTTGDSTGSGSQPPATDPGASPSPTAAPPLNSRRAEGMDRRTAGREQKPRRGRPADVPPGG